MTCSVGNQGGRRVAPGLALENVKHGVLPGAAHRGRQFEGDPVVCGAATAGGAIEVPGRVKDQTPDGTGSMGTVELIQNVFVPGAPGLAMPENRAFAFWPVIPRVSTEI